MNWTLKERLADCVCSTTEDRGNKTLYGRYLRAESFRKALVWQKRYLVVLLTGETGEGDDREPVLAIQRPRQLPKQGKWRSVVHAIIAISRMKFLVRRWRSGKRAGARLSSTASPLPSPSTSLRGGQCLPSLPRCTHPLLAGLTAFEAPRDLPHSASGVTRSRVVDLLLPCQPPHPPPPSRDPFHPLPRGSPHPLGIESRDAVLAIPVFLSMEKSGEALDLSLGVITLLQGFR